MLDTVVECRGVRVNRGEFRIYSKFEVDSRSVFLSYYSSGRSEECWFIDRTCRKGELNVLSRNRDELSRYL